MFNIKMNRWSDKESGNFTITFANGHTVSVAMGDGIYSSGNVANGFSSGEVAAWDADGKWIKLSDNDDVVGWRSPDEVLAIMNKIAAM